MDKVQRTVLDLISRQQQGQQQQHWQQLQQQQQLQQHG